MRRTLFCTGLVLALSAIAAASPIGMVKESARTTGHVVRDGSLTVGRTVRDFFTEGRKGAKRTWKVNAAKTRASARAGKARIKAEAAE